MKKILILAASIILFIELLDTTILYSCLIPVANDFGIDSSNMSLPILSYITGTCLFVPTVSWLSDKYNKITIILISLTAFSFFSLFCGLSPELFTFTFFRFLQGIAISICAATIITTLLTICASNEIVKVMGTINIPALFGTAIGPFVGAVFSYYISWRIAFIINFPIGMLIVFALMPLKSNPQFCLRQELPHRHFDWLGLILMSSCLIMLSIGFEQLSHALKLLNGVLILIGAVLGASYALVWKRRRNQTTLIKKNSILDLYVFKNRDFLFGAMANVIARSAMCGVPVLISIVLQQTYGFTVIQAGWYLAIIACAGIFAKFLSSFIVEIGVRKSVVIFSILTSFAIFSLSPLDFLAHNNYLWIACFFLGFTMSLLYTSMNSVMFLTLQNNEMSNASNIGSIIQQFSIGLGVVIAVGGFKLLSSLHGLPMMSDSNIQAGNIYKMICYALAVLLMFNFIVALPFKAYRL